MGGLGPDIDATYQDDGWERHALQADVKREWDNMLANNYEEYGLLMSGREEKTSARGGCLCYVCYNIVITPAHDESMNRPLVCQFYLLFFNILVF